MILHGFIQHQKGIIKKNAQAHSVHFSFFNQRFSFNKKRFFSNLKYYITRRYGQNQKIRTTYSNLWNPSSCPKTSTNPTIPSFNETCIFTSRFFWTPQELFQK